MKHFLSIVLIFSYFFSFSQDYNLNLIGNLDYEDDGSDIWGYVDNQGTEYAVMGIEDGTVIISLADPTNPQEVTFIDGGDNTWRDMKTYGNYAYVTTEAPDGLLVINLTDIALGIVTHSFYQPSFNNTIIQGQLQSIHNLYIDENGFCYLSGSNLNNGGILVLDLNQDPENPPLVGKGAPLYSHDVYVRNDTCWSSNVNDGHFSVIDFSDKTNPITLAIQETTFTYTHNTWLSDSGQFLFTTDELPNAKIEAFDVSDVNDIKRVDTWVPPTTAGTGVIPHNVHVHDDYLVISYYTDGIKIVDAHRPSNLVEVGSYDTYSGPMGDGLLGCWGAYPFLPSGLVLASDIGQGLLVFNPTYVRACYLEGTVTDANTGIPLNGVNINVSSGLSELTPADGEYATGQVESGTYQATYSKIGYVSQTLDITLINGQITIQNVALIPEIPVSLTGKVVDVNNNGFSYTPVRIQGEVSSYSTTTDNSGNFIINSIIPGEYDIYTGAWGYSTETLTENIIDGNPNNVTLELSKGYQDPFVVDLGWAISGDATGGIWELGEPIGTTYINTPFAPEEDVTDDIGDWCYVTGNAGGTVGDDDVDDGITILTSPVFNLSSYVDPHLSYQAFFANEGDSFFPFDDEMIISIISNNTEVVIETITTSDNEWMAPVDIRILDYVSLSNTMQLKVSVSDLISGAGHIVEGGFDNFIIYDDLSSVPVNELENIVLEIAPNPFHSSIRITIPESLEEGNIEIYDVLGRMISQTSFTNEQNIDLNTENWSSGIYQVVLATDNGRISQKIVKR